MCGEESPDTYKHRAPRFGSAGEGEAFRQEWRDDRQCNRKQTTFPIFREGKGEKVR